MLLGKFSMTRKFRHPAKGLAELLTRAARMPPTPDQQALVDAALEGANLVCIAYAGSGKTGAAVEIAHQLGARGYLILFNRSAKDDAAARLPHNISAETGHSLAFKHIIEPSDGYTQKLSSALTEKPSDTPVLSPKLIAQTLELRLNPEWHIPSQANAAHLILQTLEAFQISSDQTISIRHVPDSAISPTLAMKEASDGAVEEMKQQIVAWSTKIWSKMANERHPFPINHDTYLKLLQLRKDRIPADLWLLDEYQDTTPALADLINHQDGQKIYIGDPYQAIYGWRGAVDALRAPIESGLPVYYLAESFRYNHQIAGLATLLLRSLREPVPVKGQPRDLYPINERESHTYLARNNLSLVHYAVDCMRRGQAIMFAGGLPRDTITRIHSALALYEDRPSDIRMGAMRQFATWQKYRDFVDQQAHPQSDQRRLLHLIETSSNWLHALLNHIESGAANRRAANVVLLITTHRAKGRQWPYVKCDADLALPTAVVDKLRNQTALTNSERESVHLLYVAITRAQLGLSLAQPVKKTFSELSAFLSKPEDTPDFFCAKTVTSAPADLEDEMRRKRTEAFIRQHRRND